MSFQQPQYSPCSLTVTHQRLNREQAEQAWADLINDHFTGWGQWTGAVKTLSSASDLAQGQGALLAGECYRDQESYRLQHLGGAYSLVHYQRSEGDSHLVMERSFLTIGGAQVDGTGAGARYEVYWEARPDGLAGERLFTTPCHQVGPVAARLIYLAQ